MTPGKNEQQCLTCEGAGLVRDDRATWSWKSSLCPTCNGVGVVIMQERCTVSFDVEKSTLPNALTPGLKSDKIVSGRVLSQW